MKKRIGNELITAIALIAVGVLFLIYKSEVVSIAMSLIGLTLVVLGAVDIFRKNIAAGAIKLVIALFVFAAGWLLVKLALYILGAFLLIAGIFELYKLSNINIKKLTIPVILRILHPIIYILVAICLFFNQGGALSGVFTISGIFLIINGILGLLSSIERG